MRYGAILADLRARLEAEGIKTEIVAEAASGSCYARFEDPRMGKIRVGDHDERKQYGYRWQIRADIKFPFTDTEKGHRRFFYPANDLAGAVRHMVNYQLKLVSTDTTKSAPKPPS